MKKHLLTFLIFFCFQATIQLKAQHRYFDNNPVWVVHEYDPNSSCYISSGHIWYYLKGDTVLGGYTYHKLFRKELYEVWCPPSAPYYFGSSDTVHPYTFVRDTLKQIRYWQTWTGAGSDSLLYDFNLNMGDTLSPNATGNTGYTCGLHITAIDSIPVSNYFRKRFTYTSNQTGITYYLIEGIGWSIGFLEHIADFCPNVSTNTYYDITCYGVNDTAWFPYYDAVNPCGVPNFTVDIKEPNKPLDEITIYPNPFTLQTTINFSEEQKNTTIKITDLLGKEIKTINFTGRQLVIDKGNMKEGIYFVQTTDEKKNTLNKKIIIK